MRVSMGTPEGRGQARGGSGVSPSPREACRGCGQGVRAPGADEQVGGRGTHREPGALPASFWTGGLGCPQCPTDGTPAVCP